MAASIFKISASCSRIKICCFQRSVFKCVSPPKVILPACATSMATNQRSIIHTSRISNSEEQLFKLEKNRKEGTKHWLTERVVAIALLGMIPAACVYPNIVLDHGFAVLAPLHSYWGLQAIIGDYCWRPIVPTLKVVWLGVCVVSVVGLLYINVNDVGVTKLFGQIMTL